jgi:hypothetical protein
MNIDTTGKERVDTYLHNLKDVRQKLLANNLNVQLEAADIKKELLSGDYTKGGSITVVLDMSVTDNEEWAVQHGLKMLRRYNNPYFDKCNETEKKIDARVKTVHCYMYIIPFLEF